MNPLKAFVILVSCITLCCPTVDGQNRRAQIVTSRPTYEPTTFSTQRNVAPKPAAPKPKKDTTNAANLFYLRANLANWIVTAPSVGLEYSPMSRLGILVNVAVAPWDLDEKQRRLWYIAPQVRYYLGAALRMYAGVEYSAGQYCVANTSGEQGDFWSVGLAAGYQFSLSRSLLLDLGMTLGYMEFYNKKYFTYSEGYHYETHPALKDYGWWKGPTAVSISLVYQLF